jgi:uncharacterized protein (DUF2235 family)
LFDRASGDVDVIASQHVPILAHFTDILSQFLMRYYTPGDDIYFFGFSRGAYTARFLAEMLDHVGLLSVSRSVVMVISDRLTLTQAGNEEMCQFAWT